MDAVLDALTRLWVGVAVHLWQTTLVLLPLFVLGWTIRRGSGRVQNALWWIGALKLLVPISLVRPAMVWSMNAVAQILPLPQANGLSFIPERATAVLDPVIVTTGSSTLNALLVPLSIVLTLFWAVGAFWLTRRWIREVRGCGTLLAQSDFADSQATTLAQALEGTSIQRRTVRIVDARIVPSVVGVFRPRIAVSAHTVRSLSPAELRCVLLHEDAHRRRRDPLRSAVIRTIAFFFFYYPLTPPLLRRIRESAEVSCDEMALLGGVTPGTYAGALAAMLHQAFCETPGAAALGGTPISSMNERLRRLAEPWRYRPMRSHRVVLTAAALLVAASFLLTGAAGEPARPDAPVPALPESLVHTVREGETLESIAETYGTTVEVILQANDTQIITIRVGDPIVVPLTPAAAGDTARWAPVPPPPPVKSPPEPGAPTEPDVPTIEGPVAVYPVPIDMVEPKYPEEAKKAGKDGTVILKVTVGVDGKVVVATVADDVADCPSLSASALQAIRQWTFEAATEDGEPVEMEVMIPVEFRLD